MYKKIKSCYKKNLPKMNRYSLLLHVFLSMAVCFLVEWISRHSFTETVQFVVRKPIVFGYNALLVYSSLMLVYLCKRRAVFRILISGFWIFLGTINGCVLLKRVSPFSFTDLKMVGDLFTMQSSYFTKTEEGLVILVVSLNILLLVILWFKGPKYVGKTHRVAGSVMCLALVGLLPKITDAAISRQVIDGYFENLAQGYKDNGFIYSFTASVLDRGMSTPDGYSQKTVQEVLHKIQSGDHSWISVSQKEEQNNDGTLLLKQNETIKTASSEEETKEVQTETQQTETQQTQTVQNENETETLQNGRNDESAQMPNIICVLLESFVDPQEIGFLNCSEDPIPNFRRLSEEYSSGYLQVPVVGAGTANTEFEILTGMSMKFFGLGEYPYKTILKKTNCESIASDLSEIGYGTHVVHNNGGNFYSRRNAFSMMGFDTFTSKELMDIKEYTELGNWPKDSILLGEVKKSLDYTPDQPDFVYTITVQAHGDYPEEKVIEDPAITVWGAQSEEKCNAWEYYINQIHEVDQFIADLTDMLEKREEKTIVVFFGDHLPTMDLKEEDMKQHSLFLTKYVTWNNFGLEKKDQDLASTQLLAEILNQLDLHNGTMVKFHQNRSCYASEEEYENALELLQYDILYGEHYVYQGENPYPATDLVMGTEEVVLKGIKEINGYYYLFGKNFTRWSRIFVNDEKMSTRYLSSSLLRLKKSAVKEGKNTIVVKQMGSSDTVFRESNEIQYDVDEN